MGLGTGSTGAAWTSFPALFIESRDIIHIPKSNNSIEPSNKISLSDSWFLPPAGDVFDYNSNRLFFTPFLIIIITIPCSSSKRPWRGSSRIHSTLRTRSASSRIRRQLADFCIGTRLPDQDSWHKWLCRTDFHWWTVASCWFDVPQRHVGSRLACSTWSNTTHYASARPILWWVTQKSRIVLCAKSTYLGRLFGYCVIIIIVAAKMAIDRIETKAGRRRMGRGLFDLHRGHWKRGPTYCSNIRIYTWWWISNHSYPIRGAFCGSQDWNRSSSAFDEPRTRGTIGCTASGCFTDCGRIWIGIPTRRLQTTLWRHVSQKARIWGNDETKAQIILRIFRIPVLIIMPKGNDTLFAYHSVSIKYMSNFSLTITLMSLISW